MDDQVMRIFVPELSNHSKSVEVEFFLCEKNYNIYFRNNNEALLSGNFESFLAGAILPSMRTGGNKLVAEGQVSDKFFSGLSIIQDIYRKWDTSLHRVEISGVTPTPQISSTENRVGAFFSAGVDSFYTLLKHQDEITDLIFVHGFDIDLKDKILREKTSEKVHEVASVFDKNVIEIETNIREVLDSFVTWDALGQGAALAATGHLLSPAFHRIFIPASYTYADLFPWGSHPVLDPLWSSESLEFVHDGCEATRVEKVSLLAKHDVALQNLRVCWMNPNSSYNCGRCEKCLRTMINLKVNNALERCTTFDEKLDVANLYNIKLKKIKKTHIPFIRENLDALKRTQVDYTFEKALQLMLNGPSFSYELKRRLYKLKRRLKNKKTA